MDFSWESAVRCIRVPEGGDRIVLSTNHRNHHQLEIAPAFVTPTVDPNTVVAAMQMPERVAPARLNVSRFACMALQLSNSGERLSLVRVGDFHDSLANVSAWCNHLSLHAETHALEADYARSDEC